MCLHSKDWHRVAPKTLAQFFTQPTLVTAKYESVEKMDTDGASGKGRVPGTFPTPQPVIKMRSNSSRYEDLPY